MTTRLWVGRFQPYTLGHDDGFEQIVGEGIEKLIVGIGSAQEEFTSKNPLTYYERKEMITRTLEGRVDFEIFPIPDFGNNERWINYILENLPFFHEIYSGNPYVEMCFKNTGKQFKPLLIRGDGIKATNIREAMAQNNDWKKYVPERVADYLEEIGSPKRLEKLIKINEPRNPDLAVDGIVKYNDGIILIERKNPPFGWAFPGGFVDRNKESTEEAIEREIKEETNLDVVSSRQFRLYSDPKRDPRAHVASMVYVVKGTGKLKAKDDAINARVVPISEVEKYNLAFDHGKIFQDWLESISYNGEKED